MVETSERTTKRGYSTTVVTPWGHEIYQVWLTKSEENWVARIVTLPNRMWAQPGGREAVKFEAATEKEAETAAIHFIEQECIRTRRRMAPPATGQADHRIEYAAPKPAQPRPAPRFPHRLLVRFGTMSPERPGVTANISESGMFIITDQPAPVGAHVLIDVRLPEGPVVLGGQVVWARTRKEADRSLGFGVRLVERAREYVVELKKHV